VEEEETGIDLPAERLTDLGDGAASELGRVDPGEAGESLRLRLGQRGAVGFDFGKAHRTLLAAAQDNKTAGRGGIRTPAISGR
jgi:hypothetical protein